MNTYAPGTEITLVATYPKGDTIDVNENNYMLTVSEPNGKGYLSPADIAFIVQAPSTTAGGFIKFIIAGGKLTKVGTYACILGHVKGQEGQSYNYDEIAKFKFKIQAATANIITTAGAKQP